MHVVGAGTIFTLTIHARVSWYPSSHAEVVVALASCTGEDPRLSATPDAGEDAGSSATDAGGSSDARAADAGDGAANEICDPAAPFDPPVIIGSLSSNSQDFGLRRSADETRAYFTSDRVHTRGDAGGLTHFEVWTMTRGSATGAFVAPSRVDELSSDADDKTVGTSPNGLLAIVERVGGDGKTSMWLATRQGPLDTFSTPTLLGGDFDTPGNDGDAYLSDDDLWFYSDRTGLGDLYRAPRTGPDTFGAPEAIAAVNTPNFNEGSAVVSPDCLVLYFASSRPDGLAKGLRDIWVATRSKTSEQFGLSRNVGELNTAEAESPNWLSADRCRLYLGRTTGTSTDFLLAVRRP